MEFQELIEFIKDQLLMRVYWSKLEYTLGDVKKGYMMTLDSNKNYTRNPTKYNTSTNTGSRNSYYVFGNLIFQMI